MRLIVTGDETAAILAIDDATGETTLAQADFESEELAFWCREATAAGRGPAPALEALRFLETEWLEHTDWSWVVREVPDLSTPVDEGGRLVS